LRTTEDGVIGAATLAALPHLGPRTLAVRMLAERGRYYGSIITADSKQAVFARGWMNRLGDLMDVVA
jgi:lysozyme family protein